MAPLLREERMLGETWRGAERIHGPAPRAGGTAHTAHSHTGAPNAIL